jgi:hypothetical protein
MRQAAPEQRQRITVDESRTEKRRPDGGIARIAMAPSRKSHGPPRMPSRQFAVWRPGLRLRCTLNGGGSDGRGPAISCFPPRLRIGPHRKVNAEQHWAAAHYLSVTPCFYVCFSVFSGLRCKSSSSRRRPAVRTARTCRHDPAKMMDFASRAMAGPNRLRKDFSFRDLPSGAYSRDVRLFLIPNY